MLVLVLTLFSFRLKKGKYEVSTSMGVESTLQWTPFGHFFGSNIIVNIIQLFQKCGAFNFGYQLKFLGPSIIILK